MILDWVYFLSNHPLIDLANDAESTLTVTDQTPFLTDTIIAQENNMAYNIPFW